MSVMIQKPENTMALADFITKVLNSGEDWFNIRPTAQLKQAFSDSCDVWGYWIEEKVYRQLASLNLKAYNARYKENITDIVPYQNKPICGKVGVRDEMLNGKRAIFMRLEPWHFQIYKMLQFYLYQCDEFETCDDPIFEALCEFSDQLARYIVVNSKRYNSFDWE